jgi:hypothetical protein
MSFGLTNPGATGSCKKNGAPSISRPATEPRLHNKRAPSALFVPTNRLRSVGNRQHD